MTQTIEVSMAEVLTKLDSKIDKLDGKVSGLDKRVENLEFIARNVVGGVVVALLLGLAKFLFPNFGL